MSNYFQIIVNFHDFKWSVLCCHAVMKIDDNLKKATEISKLLMISKINMIFVISIIDLVGINIKNNH